MTIECHASTHAICQSIQVGRRSVKSMQNEFAVPSVCMASTINYTSVTLAKRFVLLGVSNFCFSTGLRVCLPACLPACLLACLPDCLLACLPTCLPACLLAGLPACLLVACLPACLHTCLLACLPACLAQAAAQVLISDSSLKPECASNM